MSPRCAHYETRAGAHECAPVLLIPIASAEPLLLLRLLLS